MKRSLFIITAVLCVVGFAGSSHAQPYGQQWIQYDGFLQMTATPEPITKSVTADTLIVVSCVVATNVFIEIFDKYGVLVADGYLLNGATAGSLVPANGFRWTTLGLMVMRSTSDPYDVVGYGEKFTFKVSADQRFRPIMVEVKQIVYETSQEEVGAAVWDATKFKAWSEAALGGMRGTGLVKLSTKAPWW